MMNSSPNADEEEQQQHLHVPPPPSNRIRSHSLKPRHSRQDYARRKSAADAASTTITTTHLELSTDNNELEQTNTPPPRRASATWLQRRFTLFSLEQEEIATNQQRRMTTGRFSIFDNKPNSNLLKRKRPSVISQMVEVVHSFIDE